MLKKLWNDPVWSKVIATGILALAGAVWVAYKQNWLPVMWRGITVAWHGITVAWAFLLGTTTVRRWVLGAFMLGTGLFILLLIGVLLIAWQAKKQTQDSPEWRSYTNDNFYGLIKWVWDYEGRQVLEGRRMPTVRLSTRPR